MNKTVNKKIIAATAAVAAVVAIAATAWAASPLFVGTELADAWKLGTPFWAAAWTVIGLVAGAALVVSALGKTGKQAVAVAVAGVTLFGSMGYLTISSNGPVRQANRSGFDAQASYLVNLRVSEEGRPGYELRLNALQAEAILEASMQDSTISDTSDPQYTVVDGAPAWCVGLYGTSAVWGMWGVERIYAKGVQCLLEAGERTVRADWPAGVRVPTIDGLFSTNLAKYVARERRGLSVAGDDVRFYIEGGKPKMLAPVTRVDGASMEPRRVPAGFVTVDEAGDLDYHTSARQGQYPVPVVPYGTAVEIREALNTRAGFWCSSRLTNPRCAERNQPLEDTSSIAGADGSAADPNAANPTEFVLRREDGRLVMVTPLTPVGKSRNTTAYLEVVVDEVADGVMPSATLYDVKPEASHLSIAQAVTSAYTADIAWITEVNGEAGTASASRIYEITPAAPGQVVATIGTSTNPEYRVVVDSTLSVGSLRFEYCIFDFESNEKLDCRASTDRSAEIGTLKGIRAGDTPAGEAISVGTDFDLSELTDEQLVELVNEAVATLAARD